MARRKGKSTRKETSNDIVAELPQPKRRRRQSIDNSNDTSPPPATAATAATEATSVIDDDLPVTDTMELDASNLDVNGDDDSDEDSIDWETVELPKWTSTIATSQQSSQPRTEDGDDIEEDHDHLESHEQYNDVQVVFEAPRAVLKKSKWEMAYQRQLRDWMHNSHVVLLVGHFLIRNDWCSRDDIKSVCLSVIPGHIASQNEQKDESDQQFYTTIKWLMAWWHDYFNVTAPGMMTRPLEAFASIPVLDPHGNVIQELETHVRRLSIQDSEKIEDPTAFVNYLAEKEGSRDLSAQLFTSLLRTLGFETRLVCSLQPIPFRIPATRTDKTPSRSSSPIAIASDQVEDTTKKTPKRNKTSTKINKSSINNTKTSSSAQYQTTKAKPPTIWCEVWNHHQQRWICVDPIRQLYNKPNQMEPGVSDRQNILSFVLAFEELKQPKKRRHRIKRVVDVTRRYTAHLTKALAQRERDLTKRERQGGWRLWSDLFLYGLQPIELYQQQKNNTQEEGSSSSSRYSMEQMELEQNQQEQQMPTSIQGLRNHPLYILERHLKKFEVLHHPNMDCSRMVIGHIRGENIYPRSCVQQIHTRETWMKQGRVVKENQTAVKRVLARAVTLEKKRIQEEAKMQGDPLQTDCFGYWQTTPYIAPPVVDGKIAKNSYGRVDLFTPEMLPEGGTHIEMDGMGKIARQLGIDYAEAVVDFEFIRGRSVPLVNGIVVAKENEFILLEAWREHEHHKTNKAMAKQEKEVYGRWRKLIQGALIDARVDTTYGEQQQQHSLLSTAKSDDEDGHAGKNHDATNNTAWDRYMKQRHLQENYNNNKDDDDDDSDGFVLEDDQDDDDDDDDGHAGGFLLDDD